MKIYDWIQRKLHGPSAQEEEANLLEQLVLECQDDGHFTRKLMKIDYCLLAYSNPDLKCIYKARMQHTVTDSGIMLHPCLRNIKNEY